MTELRHGDRVRVQIEGVVEDTDRLFDGVRVRTEEGGYILARSLVGVEVTVLEPAPPRVGDEIRREAQFDALPVGSVVHNQTAFGSTIFKTGNGWVTVSGVRVPPWRLVACGDAPVVVFIPGADE